MAPKAAAVTFWQQMRQRLGERICCVPCKDLSHVTNPAVVGLGDSFAGGLLPGLLKEFAEENAENPDPVKVINMPASVQAKLQPYVEDRLRTLCHF